MRHTLNPTYTTVTSWIAALVIAGVAIAQEPRPRLPPSAEPDVKLKQLPLEAPSKPSPEIAIPKTAPTRAPAGSEQVRFVLTGLDVAGVTAYPADVIEDVYADKMGAEISLAGVYEIAAEIQRLYRQDGYFLTRAILPPQKAREGKLRIRVLEGFISQVDMLSEIGPVQRRIQSYLENVTRQRPLKLETLERYLLLSRDIPGLKVNSLLQPSADQLGAAQLVVTVERKPFDGMVVLDNIGSSFTEEWEIAVSASSNSFTTFGERLMVTGLVSDPQHLFSGNSDNQKVLQLASSFLLGSEGLYVNLSGSYGDSNPGGTISQFDFESKKLLLSGSVGFPFIRTRNLNLTTNLGFDYIDSDTDIFNDEKFSRDRLRVLHLTGVLDNQDRWRGSNYLTLGVRRGLSVLNASKSSDELPSRGDADGQFTSILASAARHQPLGDHWAIFGNVSGQYAFDDLLSDEEFGVGGIRFGRGYDPAELNGDHGIGFTGELQYTRRADFANLDRYQLFAFYDFGKVWDRGSAPSASLASAGAGGRLWLAQNFSLELQVAKPLTRDSQRSDGDRDLELLFRAIGRF